MSQMRLSLAKVGVLILDKYIDRGTTIKHSFDSMPNHGLKIILSELNQPYEFCHASDMNNYETVICSLISVMDIENLIYSMERFAPHNHTYQLIVGGFGVCNVKLIANYIDVAVFGRGEGQINKVIAGEILPNVWRKDNDPLFTNTYTMRKPQYLCKDEVNVGCRNKCKFCFYSWARGNLNVSDSYHPGKTLNIPEDDWNRVVVDKPGRFITAWDGWSEDTRRKVNKPVTNQGIIDKLKGIHELQLDKAVVLKTYQIVGYPWETADSVQHDIDEIVRLLKDCDPINDMTKIFIMFKVNVFGPEPLTPMQYDAADIYTKWRDILRLKLYDGRNIKATILPMIDSPYTLMKRIMIHRAELGDIEMFKQIVFSSELKKLPAMQKVDWLLKYGYIKKELFEIVDHISADYLKIDGMPPYR